MMHYRSGFGFTRDYDDQYLRRLSKPDDNLAGMHVAWDADIVSCDGAHYHFWFNKCEGKELSELKKQAKIHASHQGDPVSFSYSWIPWSEVEHEQI